MTKKRYASPPERTPEGEGFGKPFVAPIGTTFNNSDRTEPKALVAMDLGGKWNHGAEDTLATFVLPEIAREMGQYLLDGADAAEADLERWKKENE